MVGELSREVRARVGQMATARHDGSFTSALTWPRETHAHAMAWTSDRSVGISTHNHSNLCYNMCYN